MSVEIILTKYGMIKLAISGFMNLGLILYGFFFGEGGAF